MLLPSTRMCELREPAYPAVNNIPATRCSTLKLNCCTLPCLKFVFCARMVPVKSSGFGGAVKIGKPCETLIADGVCPNLVAQAAVAKVHASKLKSNASDSA